MAGYTRLQQGINDLKQMVEVQAKDEGLWFEAITAPEAYLQAALRRLHVAIEEGL